MPLNAVVNQPVRQLHWVCFSISHCLFLFISCDSEVRIKTNILMAAFMTLAVGTPAWALWSGPAPHGWCRTVPLDLKPLLQVEKPSLLPPSPPTPPHKSTFLVNHVADKHHTIWIFRLHWRNWLHLNFCFRGPWKGKNKWGCEHFYLKLNMFPWFTLTDILDLQAL